MKTQLWTYMVSGAVAVLSLAATSHADIILDSFTETNTGWPHSVSVNDLTLIPVTESVSSVLGGQRATALGQSTMDFPNVDNAIAQIYNSGSSYSFLDYRSSVGAAATLELDYGTGTPLNLTGVNALKVAFLNYDMGDAGPMHVVATLYGGATSAQYSANVTQVGAQDLTIPINFPAASVSRIVLDFVAPKGSDYRIDALSVTVPEPMSLGVLVVGSLALMARRRRG